MQSFDSIVDAQGLKAGQFVPSRFFVKHQLVLRDWFANANSFGCWLGYNEKKLPLNYSVRDVIELRKKQLGED